MGIQTILGRFLPVGRSDNNGLLPVAVDDTGALKVVSAGIPASSTQVQILDGSNPAIKLRIDSEGRITAFVSGEIALDAATLTALENVVVTGSVTVDNFPAPVTDVSVNNFPASQPVTMARELTERMFAKAPVAGYNLWFDTADAAHLYTAEAPSGADPAMDTTWRGIRITLDANGNPVGEVQQATDFNWNARTTAGWT